MSQEPKVVISPDVPYLIYGKIPLFDKKSKKEYPEQEMVALCRCGYSRNKPFCDGEHLKQGQEAK